MESMLNSKTGKSAFLLKKSKSDLCNLNLGIKPTDSTHQTEWKQIKSPSSKISCRFHHSSVLSAANIYIYGGYDNNSGILSDFKLFVNDNSLNPKWVDLTTQNGPGPRHSHSAVIHNQTIYIFGGKVDRINSTNKVHAFSIKDNKWALMQTKAQNQQNSALQIPKPTDSHQAIVIGDEMIVYGGFCNNQFTNHIHSLNLLTKKWTKIYPSQSHQNKADQPQPRSDFSMVLFNQKLYIYAGKNLSRSFNDLWQFDFKTLKFTKILAKKEPRENRSGHSAAIYKQYMIIFGGISSVTHQRDDLLTFNFETKEWRTIWKNSQQKYQAEEQKKKFVHKKLSSSKIKCLQNNSIINKYEGNQKQQIRKYRRPLAEQKQINVRSQINFETDRSKKQKERKIMLINDIEATTMPYQHSYSARYSPLIESLTNSIMLTSSIHNNTSGNFREHVHKHLTISQQNENDKDGQKKLKARDGHTAHILQNEMLIFGGDRHMIGINDVVFLNLGMLIHSKEDSGNAETCRQETHEDDHSENDEPLLIPKNRQSEK